MGKNRDLQALPEDFPLLAQVNSGAANVYSLETITMLLNTIRTGRMTDRRVSHVRQHHADEIGLYDMAIQLAAEQPSLLDLHLDLVSNDGMLEHLLGHVAVQQQKDALRGRQTIRGFRKLKPTDAEIGWSTHEQVNSINEFLSDITCDDLCAEFDPVRIASSAVYKSICWELSSAEQLRDCLEPLLKKTKQFYKRVSEAGFGVLSVRG